MKQFKLLTSLLTLFTLSYGCNSTNSSIPSTSFDLADGIRGGIIYDTFFATEANFSKASDKNLVIKLKMNQDFFRCKQCHAWDLKGQSASYNNRAPNATRPNVSAVDLSTLVTTKTPQQLFDGIKTGTGKRRDVSYDLTKYNPTSDSAIGDQMPNYSQLLSDKEIWDLVKFLKNEVVDVTKLYDAKYTGSYPKGKTEFSNIGKDGDAVAGKEYYTNNCASCHGFDGKLIPDLDKTVGMSTGKFMRSKPQESQHKIKFGHLGSTMVASKSTVKELKDLYKATADKTTFPD